MKNINDPSLILANSNFQNGVAHIHSSFHISRYSFDRLLRIDPKRLDQISHECLVAGLRTPNELDVWRIVLVELLSGHDELAGANASSIAVHASQSIGIISDCKRWFVN